MVCLSIVPFLAFFIDDIFRLEMLWAAYKSKRLTEWNLANRMFLNFSKVMMPSFSCLSQVRSSRPVVFCKKGVLRNLAKFAGKHLCQSLFFNKVVAGLRHATLLILHVLTIAVRQMMHACICNLKYPNIDGYLSKKEVSLVIVLGFLHFCI